MRVQPQDVYRAISEVCPEGRDILQIGDEEVASRLNLYSTKLVLLERPTCESEDEGSWEESREGNFFGEVQLDMRLI